MIGLNFPADLRLSPQVAAFLGARWLRVVLLPDVDLTPWIAEAHQRGLKVLGVIARESMHGAVYAETARFYAGRYGHLLDAVQCGNESDHESPSSWTMEQAELNTLLAEVNYEFPGETTIVGPGLVSGNPHYLDAVDLDLVDAIAVHPYGRHPSEGGWGETPGGFGTFEELIDAYAYHGKRVWITEVGVSTTQVSEAFQARYCVSSMVELMTHRDVDVVCWFAADDEMVPEFGLYANGLPKPSATAFMRAAGSIPEPPPSEEPIMEMTEAQWEALWKAVEPNAVYRHEFGIEEYWRDHMDQLGSPTQIEQQDGEWRAFSKNKIVAWTPQGAVVLP